ncbi:hypothetical protein F511_45006 [Dorcoceras hygrometricum]|uniref:Uncharacterized protein n=1 Tax=Dorcoceras hygrometricum TaxID=472368 RepID=A0A2Z7CW04_9LAMI|nr:hypothetical protein F511_45006 [Dorcoceras hygrometricum]
MQTALAKADSRLGQPKLRTAGYSKLNPAQQCPMLDSPNILQIKDQLSAYPGQFTHRYHMYGSANDCCRTATRYISDRVWKNNHQ